MGRWNLGKKGWGGGYVEEAGVEQLLEVGDDAHVDQVAHVRGHALTQLLAVHPLAGEHPAAGELVEGARDHHLRPRRRALHGLGSPASPLAKLPTGRPHRPCRSFAET